MTKSLNNPTFLYKHVERIYEYDINDFDATLPRISMWAEETSPVHWRMFGSEINNNDEYLPKIVNSARGVYHGFYVYNTTIAVVSGVAGFWNPFMWALTATSIYRAAQWKKGRNWIDDSENIWSSLIKTSRREPQTYWTNVWEQCAYPPRPVLDKTSLKSLRDIDCGEWKWEQRTRYVSVNYPSDGLLPQYTQELEGISGNNRYKVEGANHIEVRNMSNSSQGDITRERFNEIFNRQGLDFFRTD